MPYSGTRNQFQSWQFRDKIDESTMVFYKKLQLEKASFILKQTTLSITDIVFATGYFTSVHFSGDFREKIGIAPSEYRAQRGSAIKELYGD